MGFAVDRALEIPDILTKQPRSEMEIPNLQLAKGEKVEVGVAKEEGLCSRGAFQRPNNVAIAPQGVRRF